MLKKYEGFYFVRVREYRCVRGWVSGGGGRGMGHGCVGGKEGVRTYVRGGREGTMGV